MSENNAKYGAPGRAESSLTAKPLIFMMPTRWQEIIKDKNQTEASLSRLIAGLIEWDDIVFENMLITKARACHNANNLWCEKNGDNSQVSWEQASEDVKLSALKGVLFALTNPTLTPEDQHNAWMKDKVEAGWVYGTEKNPEAKTHPCIVRYHQLPEFQKFKDEIFRAIALS